MLQATQTSLLQPAKHRNALASVAGFRRDHAVGFSLMSHPVHKKAVRQEITLFNYSHGNNCLSCLPRKMVPVRKTKKKGKLRKLRWSLCPTSSFHTEIQVNICSQQDKTHHKMGNITKRKKENKVPGHGSQSTLQRRNRSVLLSTACPRTPPPSLEEKSAAWLGCTSGCSGATGF